VVALAAVALAGPVSQASAATAGPRAEATIAKTCGAGYLLAHLSWGEKCLRRGELCKVGSPQYGRYGFVCPATGHLEPR